MDETISKMAIHAKPSQIYNVEETGFSLVHKPIKIVGLKGKRQLHAKTSYERGKHHCLCGSQCLGTFHSALCCIQVEEFVPGGECSPWYSLCLLQDIVNEQ